MHARLVQWCAFHAHAPSASSRIMSRFSGTILPVDPMAAKAFVAKALSSSLLSSASSLLLSPSLRVPMSMRAVLARAFSSGDAAAASALSLALASALACVCGGGGQNRVVGEQATPPRTGRKVKEKREPGPRSGLFRDM